MAPVNEMAKSAINMVKYIGEISSEECHEEYFIISFSVFSKRIAARKYPIKPIVLPIKVRIHNAERRGGRFFRFMLSVAFYELICRKGK